MDIYLDIINHFGRKNQMKKLNEEVYELLEAINNYEEIVFENETYDDPYSIDELNIFREHIIEEMGDVLILLTEFIGVYDIKKVELDKWMDYKLDRTMNRIETKFYEKRDTDET